jgi:GNAT superfamily N-acetyltransferase
LTFADATSDDVDALLALQNETAAALSSRFGHGHWSGSATRRGLEFSMRHARYRVGRDRSRILTVLRLATRKPWAIDVTYFTPCERPLYLTSMAVAKSHQGRGLGRAALEDALAVARAWPADAVRLDSYDAAVGAGGFYARCGFEERGRVSYRRTPLVYYERRLL